MENWNCPITLKLIDISSAIKKRNSEYKEKKQKVCKETQLTNLLDSNK